LAAALAQLDVGFVQAEGGALLNGALAAADLIDELNLTISPQLAGGDGPRVTGGAAHSSRRMRLAHVLEDDGFLFTRYVRAPLGDQS
jgi:riboflavin biosynthesis pyrimidine reductase